MSSFICQGITKFGKNNLFTLVEVTGSQCHILKGHIITYKADGDPFLAVGFLQMSELQAKPLPFLAPMWSIYLKLACLCAKSLQSCLTLCDTMGCSPPGSSVLGILQARILEWVAMPSSRGSSWPRDWTWISYISSVLRIRWLPRWHRGKESACHCRAGRFPGGVNDNPLQYSCLENPMDRGAWWDTVHGVPKVLDMTEHTGTQITYHTITTRTTRSHSTLLFLTREHILIIIPSWFGCLF